MEADIPLHRDVVLLLKCKKPVNWVIEAHRVTGRLEVVVCSHNTNTGIFPRALTN